MKKITKNIRCAAAQHRAQSTQIYKYHGQFRTSARSKQTFRGEYFCRLLEGVWISSFRTRSHVWHCSTRQPGPGLGEGLRLGAFEQSKPTLAEIALVWRSLPLWLTLAHSLWASVRFRGFAGFLGGNTMATRRSPAREQTNIQMLPLNVRQTEVGVCSPRKRLFVPRSDFLCVGCFGIQHMYAFALRIE